MVPPISLTSHILSHSLGTQVSLPLLMRSFLFRPGIFYTLCLGPSSLEPHLAGLFASFSAELKHHLLREDSAHHHGPGPPPAPLTSTDHCLPHHLYFLYRIFLNLETLFSLVWVALEQMVQCDGHEARNLFFFPLDHLDQ